MKKSTMQLIIAATALAGALALAVYAAPVLAEVTCPADALTCQPAVKPWKEYRTDNNGAEFAAAWIAASRECGGENTACIEARLKEQGWKWQTGY